MKFLEIISTKSITLLVIAAVFLTLEVVLSFSKKKIGVDFENKRELANKFKDIEKDTILYYRRNQTLDVVRVISAIVGVLVLLVVFNIQALNILAIAVGAIIIILKDQIISFIAYFYVISVFDIGDDLKIGDILGEVVKMKPLYVALAGKDITGQYNGKLHYIPNFKIMTDFVEESEIKTDTVRRIDLDAVYNHTTFPDTFPVWKDKLKDFLDQTLPLQKNASIGNFKSFVGIRYQIRFNYNEKGEVVAKISYVAKPPKTSEYKETIISFIESMRR